MDVIDLAKDDRIGGLCATVRSSYKWYLDATAGAEDNLKIQRAIIKDSKAYNTLRADLRRGCILPPIVLAISNIPLPPEVNVGQAINDRNIDVVKRQLADQLRQPRPQDIYIIDGLQRTNALRQTLDAIDNDQEREAFLSRPLRVEIWLNIPFSAIAYRMLLLNAGQKPMSIKHQVEILSIQLKDDLNDVVGLRIQSSQGGDRRNQAGDFTLAKLSQAFQAWLQGSPNIDVRNIVMEQLLAESALETLGTSLAGQHPSDEFKSFISWLVEMDRSVWQIEPQFFGNETVLLGIAAAVGAAQKNELIRQRMKRGLEDLRASVAQNGAEVLAIPRFNALRQGEDVRKVNVGQFTREMVYRAFKEYFLSDGTKSLEDCWAFGAAQA